MIIFLTAIYLTILITEAPLFKTKKKEFWICFAILSLAYLVSMLTQMGIKLPKPIDYIERFIRVFIKA